MGRARVCCKCVYCVEKRDVAATMRDVLVILDADELDFAAGTARFVFQDLAGEDHVGHTVQQQVIHVAR
jgi:hypothetical protein